MGRSEAKVQGSPELEKFQEKGTASSRAQARRGVRGGAGLCSLEARGREGRGKQSHGEEGGSSRKALPREEESLSSW